MGKQTFDKTKKILSILIVIFFVISITVAVVNTTPGATDTKEKNQTKSGFRDHQIK